MSFFKKLLGQKGEPEPAKPSQTAAPRTAPPVAPPAPPPASPAPGIASQSVQKVYRSGDTILGRYEVVGDPLMGGMGIVYICRDQQQDLPVALKTFKPEYLPDRATRDRFLREGTTWMNLGAHPHIVRCYEVIRDTTGLEVYLALELIAKGQEREDASLRSWLPLRYGSGQAGGRPLPPETALLFALQITRGMQHAVARIPGFVHRDLKPENVLVGADHLPDTQINRLRVTDFGLAKIVETNASITHSNKIDKVDVGQAQFTQGAGTKLYMSPEQWQGAPVGVYTDAYALGCILYEMFTGYTAAPIESWEALEYAHRTGNLRPLPESIPAPVRYILRRCLALNPGDRYADWESLEFALASAYATIAERPAPPPADATVLIREELLQIASSYSVIGIAYLDIGKVEVAISYFERAIAILQSENLYSAQALLGLGGAYQQLGDTHRAIGYYEQALVITRDMNDALGESTVLNNLGVAHKNLGDLRKAIQYYEQALIIDRKLGHKIGESDVLGNLGVAYKNLGDANRAIQYYEQALTIQRELGHRIEEVITLGNLGIAYKDLGDTRQAIKYYEQALVIRREIGDRYGEGNDLTNLGVAYGLLGDAHRDISFTEQALTIWREIGNRRGEGRAVGNLGAAYARLGETRRANELYSQALTIAREIGDIDGVARQSFNIARLYTEQGKMTQALPLAQEAAQIWTQIGSPSAQIAQQLVVELDTQIRADVELIESFTPLIQAIAAAARGDRQARAAVEEAFPHIEQNGWNIIAPIRRIWTGERNEAILTAEMDHGHTLLVREILAQIRTQAAQDADPGITHVDSDDPHSAISYYSQQLEIARKASDPYKEMNALGSLGVAYAALGNTQNAIAFYEKYYEVARKIGERRDEGNALGNLGNAYANLGNTRRAVEYYEQALVILREAGDNDGVAHFSFNMARLYVQQDDITRAIPLAQKAALLWKQIGSPNRQQAEQFMVELQKIESQKQEALTETKQAFQAFQATDSLPAMRRAVAQFPLMRSPGFMTLVEQSIAQYVPSHLKSAFEQRRKWLQQIVKERK
ncbi:MAG TPA: tetratricopeptide repeat protein [Anaerolineae bacterium]|nr:tetratricopeptide repeat protein [Anaerolineae bacterium]HQI83404.1 tetratricopeptide repeat protein [Anaerolineae bacterium]